jgi:hypothetical protein
VEGRAVARPVTPEKRAFIGAADAVCDRYNTAIRRLGSPGGTLAEQAAAAHRINVLTLREMAELRHLTPPADDRQRITALIKSGERALRSADRSTVLIETDPEAATAGTIAAARLLRRVNAGLDEYGLHTCASS